MKILLIPLIVLIFGTKNHAQNNDILAKSYFLKAQENYSEGNNASALKNLEKTVEYKGSTNPRIESMYVKITFRQNNYKTAKNHLNTYFELAEENHSDYMEMLIFVADIENKLIEEAQKEQQDNQLQQLRDKANFFKYEDASPFNEGMASVKINDKWGFINEGGGLTITATYEKPKGNEDLVFHNGYVVARINRHFILLDKTGKLQTGEWQELSGNIEDGILAIKMDSKWGHYDFFKGQVVTPIEYDGASDFSDGLAYVEKDIKKDLGYNNDGSIYRGTRLIGILRGVIDKKGENIIPLGYNKIHRNEIRDGVILITNEVNTVEKSLKFFYGHYGMAIFNKNGKRITDYKYYIDAGAYFSEGYLTASLTKLTESSRLYENNMFGIIDTSGNEIIPFEYKRLGNVKYGMVWAKNSEGIGILNINAKIVIPFGKYESVKILYPEVIAVKKNGLWGLINHNENEIVPMIYDDIKSGMSFKTYAGLSEKVEGLVLVKKFDKWSFMNLKGKYLGE